MDHWLSNRPTCGLPGRRHFDPVAVPSLPPNIMLVEAPPPSAELTFCLVGTQLKVFLGANFTGKPVISAYQKSENSRAYIDMRAVMEDGLPRWRRNPATFVENREHVMVERLYVPVAEDGVKVDMILGLLLARIGDDPVS